MSQWYTFTAPSWSTFIMRSTATAFVLAAAGLVAANPLVARQYQEGPPSCGNGAGCNA
ncbi:hypothetical protein PM082_024078 [Marasmius tenuissimus]|nr:hypothetical protein PM082_024078 [Marasmius tenuissimus]